MKLVWTTQLSVGNAVIDSDHKNLIALIHGIERAISAKDPSVISQAFEFLEGWLCVHFANEEKIARAVNFDFFKHKQAQQNSLRELQHLRDAMAAKEDVWCESTTGRHSHSLRCWMTEHITRIDMPMKPALQARDYIFWPGHGKGEVNHAAGRAASVYLHHFDTPALCTV